MVMDKLPEVTWSLMHPTPLNVDYMKRVITEAANYKVDSFEICAACHTLLGGLDGLVLYEDYPAVAASLDREGIIANRRRLNEILELAHASGRPVYYWHREVTVWPEFLKAVPELRDANGEFDLLGDAFETLLRYKLAKAFDAVPALDGIVLTLTEADFSAIHNSTPGIYPPEQVVAKIVRIFAGEHAARGKRFILRSFGSIAKDYEDILAGAALAAKEFSFEVETKITPYDFDTFLPDNPFMKRIPNLTLGAECDSLGEFLGAGYLPAENVENIVRYVRWGQKCGVDRFTIRLDRIGNNIFDSYPVNLFAYEQAILNPGISAQEIRRRYAETHYPVSCRKELEELGAAGYEVVTKLHYIDHHLIFHQFPLQADLKWIKAGGIFGVFKDHRKLNLLNGIWSILSERTTPGRERILREKEEALVLAEKNLARVEKLRPELSEAESLRLKRLWSNAVTAGKAIGSFVRVVCAYFDDMEAGREEAPGMEAAIASMKETLLPLMTHPEEFEVASAEFVNGMDHHVFTVAGNDLDQVYLKPLLGIVQLLRAEYRAEFEAREKAGALPGVVDFIIPGGITDECRCGRFMHASHALLKDGRPGRLIGNQVFPNGYLECFLKGDSSTPQSLLLEGTGDCRISVNGRESECRLDDAPRIDLAPCGEVHIVLRKLGNRYPLIRSIAVCRKP